MINIGMTGFGSFADRTLAPGLAESKIAKLVALQKRDRARAEQAAKKWKCKAFTNPAELIRDPEVHAIYAAGLNSTRCAETILAAEAGKHVLVEKPMAMNTAECIRMIDACKANNVKLMVAQHVRFSPIIQKVREIIQSGWIGDVNMIHSEFMFNGERSDRTWLFDRRLAGGGPVFDVAVHCIDTIRYILRDEVVKITSILNPQPTSVDTERSSVITMQFKKGTLASVATSFEAGCLQVMLKVSGSKGYISVDGFTFSKFNGLIILKTTTEDGTESTKNFEIPVGDLYTAEIDHFAECILKDKPCLISGEEGLANQRILDEAMKG